MNSGVRPPFRAEGRFISVLNPEGQYVPCGSMESTEMAIHMVQAVVAYDTEGWDDAVSLVKRVHDLLTASMVLPLESRRRLAELATRYSEALYQLAVGTATLMLEARGIVARTMPPTTVELPDGDTGDPGGTAN